MRRHTLALTMILSVLTGMLTSTTVPPATRHFGPQDNSGAARPVTSAAATGAHPGAVLLQADSSVSIDNAQSNGAATGTVLDDANWPTVVVALKNDHSFWLKASIWNQINDVAILMDDARTNTWARLGYIPPGAEAVYALRLDPVRDSTIQFFVNAGRTEDGSLSAGVVTTLQRTIDTVLTAVGGSARFQDASLQTLIASIDQLTELADCVDAVEGVLRQNVLDIAAFSTNFVTCLTDERQAAVLASVASRFGTAVTKDTLRNVVFTPIKLVELSVDVGDTLFAIVTGSWAGSIVVNSVVVPDSSVSEPAVSMFRGNPTHTGVMPGPGPEGVAVLKWTFPLAGSTHSSPAVAGGVVYIGGNELYAVDADTGTELWRRHVGGSSYSSPTVVGDTVYIGSDGIVALDTASGDELWRFAQGEEAPGSPTVVDGTLYLGTRKGLLYAVDANTGIQRWQFRTDGEISSSPAVDQGVVYVGGTDSYLYAVDASTGVERWRFRAGDGIASSPAVVDDVVYVGSNDRHVYALDAASGSERWRFDTGRVVQSSPAVVDGAVFIGSGGTGTGQPALYSLDAMTGTERWRTDSGHFGIDSSPVVVDDRVYVGTGNGEVLGLDAASGMVMWRFAGAGFVSSSPTVVDGIVYVADLDGTLYAIGGTTGPYAVMPPPEVPEPTVVPGGSPVPSDGDACVPGTLRTEAELAALAQSPTGRPAMYRGDPAHSGVETDWGPAESPKARWQFAGEGKFYESPMVADGVAYVGDYFGNVYAVDAETGAERWRVDAGLGTIRSVPAIASGTVYLAGYGLFAFDAATGAQLWTVETCGGSSSSPTVMDDVVYFSAEGPETFEDFVYAVDAQTGVVRWMVPAGDVETSLTVASGLVYFGDFGGSLHALDVETGIELWSFQPDGQISGSTPAYADSTLFVGYIGRSSSVYAIDATTGQERWQFETGGDIRSSPAVANGVVYVGSDDSFVYALDAATGGEVWRFSTDFTVSASPTYSDGVVYVGSNDNRLYAIDAGTGTERWRFQFHADVTGSAVVADGSVYLTVGGTLYALGSGNSAVSPTPLATTMLGSGELIWRFEPGEPSYDQPVLIDETVYVRTGFSLDAVDAISGNRRWHFKTGGDAIQFEIVNGTLIATSADTYLYALDAATGRERWRFHRGDYYPYLYDLNTASFAIANDTVVIPNVDGDLVALDVATGRELWRSGAGDFGSATPVIVGQMVYLGSRDADTGNNTVFHALDLRTGSELWRTADLSWSDQVFSDDERLYLFAYTEIYALDRTSGNRAWQYLTGGQGILDWTLTDGSIYFVTDDSLLRMVETATGIERLVRDITAPWYGATLIADTGTLFVTAHLSEIDEGVSAVDPATGDIRWTAPAWDETSASFSIVQDRVYVIGGEDGLMVVLDAATGQTVWTYQLDPILLQTIYPSPLTVENGVIYVAHNESLYAIRVPSA